MILCSIWEATQLFCQAEPLLETHAHASLQYLFRKKLWCRSCCRPQHAYLLNIEITRVYYVLYMTLALTATSLAVVLDANLPRSSALGVSFRLAPPRRQLPFRKACRYL